jgi:hypothetical protein
MAKIDSYSTATPALADLLLGTDSDSANATKNFTVESLKDFIQGNIGLQNVLDTDNISTGPMILDGSLRINSGLLDATGGLGTNGQALLSTGTTVSWGEPEVGKLLLPVRYAEAVVKGDPLYISGFNVGQNRLEVSKAASDDPNKMPAIGLADAAYAMNDNGTAISIGSLADIDLSTLSPAPSVGDVLYIKAGGGLTKTTPTGTELIQNVGIVSRTGVTGAIEVTAIGRSNALPNFTPEGISYGLSTGVPAFSSLLRYNEVNNTQGATTFVGRTTLATQLLKLPGIPTHADNAAALAADLVVDDVYKTATGELRIVV